MSGMALSALCSMTAVEVIRAMNDYRTQTAQYPTLLALHPDDLEYLSADLWGDAYAVVERIGGVRVVPCPDTEPGAVEVLRPPRPF